MPEREKPRTPSVDELWLERKEDVITLPGREEMRRRLHEILKPEKPEHAERNFFPMLLQYAGEKVSVSRIPTIVISAVRAYLDDDVTNFRHPIGEYCPRVIDAMIVEPHAKKRAQNLLLDSLNG